LETLHLPVEITPIIPFPFQQEKKEFIGLKISGRRLDVHNIEKYLTSDDVMKFIQKTRQYYKQLEHQREQQREQQQKITAMAHKALESSTSPKTFSSSMRPYPQLFFTTQQQRKKYGMSFSPTSSKKQQKQDW
jgi:hypothetical protein